MSEQSYDDGNVFARILRGELPCERVYENDYALAFRDAMPRTKVHVLVVPKGKYVSMADFSARASAAEIEGMVRAIGAVTRIENLEENGYRILSNHGEDARQEVPHFHVHVFGGEPLGWAISPSISK